MTKTNRPEVTFNLPDVYGVKPIDPELLKVHQQRLADLVQYDLKGFSWQDAYLLAFGYNGIQPFNEYIEIAPNSVSSLIGRIVVTESDYLDVIYTQRQHELNEWQMLAELPEPVGRGRPRLSIEEQLARSAARSSKQEEINRYRDACRERQNLLKKVWQEYQDALVAKANAEAHHKKICADLYKQHQDLKSVPINREDYK